MTDYQLHEVGVKAMIRNMSGEVLVVREAEGGKWELPGGRIMDGESIEETWNRELKEELGIEDVVLGHAVSAQHGSRVTSTGQRLMMLFFETRIHAQFVIKLSAEHYDLLWAGRVTLEGLDMYESDLAAVLSLSFD